MTSRINHSQYDQMPSAHERKENRFSKFFKGISFPKLGESKKQERDREGIERMQKLIQINYALTEEATDLLKRPKDQIQNWMIGKSLDPQLILAIQNHIQSVTNNDVWDLSQKMAELGVLYFYLARDGSIPEKQKHLLDCRCDEIEMQLASLSKRHMEYCPNRYRNLLPSGTLSYLTAELARMIFTPDGTFNEGGCYAVYDVLNNESLFVTHEMRTQIISTVDRLLNDEAFRHKFMQPFSVHSDFKDLIQLDLKLPQTTDPSSADVRLALLINFFTPIGQFEELNCFAVAVQFNLFEQHQDIVLDVMKDILQQGFFMFEGKKIPAWPLLEARRHYKKDFQVNISEAHAEQLRGFIMAQKVLGIKNSVAPSSVERPLGEIMEERFSKESTYAKELFLSLKCNYLQKLFLSVLQFISLNSKKCHSEGERIFVSWRIRLINLFIQFVDRHIGGIPKADADKIIEYFRNHFESFYLIDSLNGPSSQNLGEGQRQLVFLKQAQFKFSDQLFQIIQNFKEIVDAFPSKNVSKEAKKELEEFKKFLKSDEAKKELIWTATEDMDGLRSSPDEDIKDETCLCFAQQGGDAGLILLWEPLSHLVDHLNIFNSKNIETFFLELCHRIKVYQEKNPDFFERINPQILFKTSQHVFNISPQYFEFIWGDNPEEMLNEYVKKPAEGMRSLEFKKDFLGSYAEIEGIEEGVYDHMNQENMTFADFREEALKRLNPDEHECFDEIFNHQLTGISFDSFKDTLPQICADLGIPCPESEYERFEQQIFNALGGKKTCFVHELAEALYNEFPLIPPFEIERVICNHFALPHSLILGSLNFAGNEQSELVNYFYLTLKYDLAKNQLVLCERMFGKKDTPLTDSYLADFLEEATIYFEALTSVSGSVSRLL